MRVFKFLLLLVSVLFVFSCANKKAASKDKEYINKGYTVAMVVDNTDIAGCGFLLQINDSVLITPTKLSNEFKKDKLKVYVKYELLKKQPFTNCMRGKAANIVEILIANNKN